MHDLIMTKGTDARNHVVRCTCGWAASDTFKDIRKRGEFHLRQDNPLAWNDPARQFQSAKEFPPFIKKMEG